MSPDEIDDILSVLDAAEAPDDFHTRRELQELLKVSEKQIYRLLEAMGKLDRLKRINKMVRSDVTGKHIPRPAYKILPRKGKKR